ncbi:SH3 domain-containing protein, partial [Candidatus Peregrinibacteria bacterium]|nr:SH3 domain-containing protein [Candidatus Peregrinibacteria bacterium]
LVVDGQDQIDPDQPIILDLSNVDTYSAIRGEGMNGSKDSYRVTNTFLNIRSAPSVTSDNLGRLDKGDEMEIIEFHNAAWAKARLLNGREGFVAIRYIAKVTSEEKLSIEKEKFADQYFVNFGFLNVRKDPDADSEKIGELPGQTIVKPLSVDEVWARIPFDGKDGYVAVQYLKPFLPNFLVRQEKYSLPVLQYDMSREGMSDSLVKHVAKLKEEGVDLMTFRDFSDVLISQQERDVRVGPNTVILSVSGITGENVKEVSDILRASSATATFFIQTNQIGLDGITEKMLQTLLANGNDIQSSGHTGDDLRSLTNSQIELELRQSRQLLEEKIGSTITAVLYPLGGVNSRVEEIAASAGYLFGVGVRPEREVMRDELLMMPSFTILPSMTGQDIITIALGTSEEEPQEE